MMRGDIIRGNMMRGDMMRGLNGNRGLRGEEIT